MERQALEAPAKARLKARQQLPSQMQSSVVLLQGNLDDAEAVARSCVEVALARSINTVRLLKAVIRPSHWRREWEASLRRRQLCFSLKATATRRAHLGLLQPIPTPLHRSHQTQLSGLALRPLES